MEVVVVVEVVEAAAVEAAAVAVAVVVGLHVVVVVGTVDTADIDDNVEVDLFVEKVANLYVEGLVNLDVFVVLAYPVE